MIPRVVIFDVDGTLVDSQAHIVAAMTHAFETCDLPVPSRSQILSQIGLSLPVLMAGLAGAAHADALSAAYRDSFRTLRESGAMQGDSPLYPGTRDMLARLSARDDLLLAIATGKSRRGLDALITAHGMERLFISRQTADTHPSKPHPSMIQTVLAETGIAPAQAIMVGDTEYDMEMGRAAGVATVGVPWGYHGMERLRADRIIADWAELDAAIEDLTGGVA